MSLKKLRDEGWVKSLAAMDRPFTSREAGKARQAAGNHMGNYGPDVITRLRNCKDLELIDAGESGYRGNKLYRLRIKGDAGAGA